MTNPCPFCRNLVTQSDWEAGYHISWCQQDLPEDFNPWSEEEWIAFQEELGLRKGQRPA